VHTLHFDMSCQYISGAQKDDRKKREKTEREKRERKLFHTCMQSKIKIPNKPQNNKKTSKPNRNIPKTSNPKHMEGEGGRKKREGEEQMNSMCFA